MGSSISGDLAGESRIPLESMGRATEVALSPGQRFPARVIEMLLTGDVLLELGRSRATVPTSTPLRPGELVRLEVVTAGPTPEFRIVTNSPAATTAPEPEPELQIASDKIATALSPRDLPVIMRALAEMVPNGTPVAQAGQTFIRAAVAADLPAAVVEQIQHVLAPLHAALPPVEMAPVLRAFLAQSGLFTENHLGAALREHPGPLTAEQRNVIADVRFLLGALTTAGTPAPDPVRAFGEALLQQQLVVAEQVAATSSGQIAIPFTFDEERVDIHFTWDREPREETRERSAPDDDRAIALGVFVNLNIFGAIEARLVWKPEAFAVTFYVEREATRAIVEAGLSELSKELSASGFSAVAMNVWLNPDRVSAGVTPVRPALPAGTILDVMV